MFKTSRRNSLSTASRSSASLCAVALLATLAGAATSAMAQNRELKNDSIPIPLPSGQTANVAISIGFGPGEQAMAIYKVDPAWLPLQVRSIGVLWYSNIFALTGGGLSAPNALQDSLSIYTGNSPDPNQMTLVGNIVAPLLTDGAFNIFDALPYSIVVTSGTYLGLSLKFDSNLDTGGAPSGDFSKASVCYDQTTANTWETGSIGNPAANWINSIGLTRTVSGFREGWIRYRDLRSSTNQPPAGFDVVMRVYTQPYVPPICLADVASDSLDTTRNPNGSIGPEDLDAFIAGFVASNLDIADVASDSLDTTFTPNGQVGPEDLDAFIASFIAGSC